MDTIEQRVLQIRKSLNLSQAEFAKRIYLKQGVISAIEVGRTPLTEQNLKVISLVFGIRDEWLRYGIGEIFEDERDVIIKEIVDLLRKLSPEAQQVVLEYVRLVVNQQQTLTGNAALPAREDTITTSVKNPDITIKKRDPAPESEAGGAAG